MLHLWKRSVELSDQEVIQINVFTLNSTCLHIHIHPQKIKTKIKANRRSFEQAINGAVQ